MNRTARLDLTAEEIQGLRNGLEAMLRGGLPKIETGYALIALDTKLREALERAAAGPQADGERQSQ
jgi:hypothetical protein